MTVRITVEMTDADFDLYEQSATRRDLLPQDLISRVLHEVADQQRDRLRGNASTEARRRAAQKGNRS